MGFHFRVQQITGLPKEILEESEPLQIRKFEEGTYHYYQQDSEPFFEKVPCCLYGDYRECRVCRFITVTYFLSDVKEGGEIVFPLANSHYEVRDLTFYLFIFASTRFEKVWLKGSRERVNN